MPFLLRIGSQLADAGCAAMLARARQQRGDCAQAPHCGAMGGHLGQGQAGTVGQHWAIGHFGCGLPCGRGPGKATRPDHGPKPAQQAI
jgi:hypothetical protein